MKHIKSKFAAWIGLLAVCLLPVAVPAEEHQEYQSGIIGQVEGSGGLFVEWAVTVRSANGTFIGAVLVDNDGFFMLDLNPGTYLLTPEFASPILGNELGSNVVILCPTTRVTVRAHRFTAVELPTGLGGSFPIGGPIPVGGPVIPLHH